MSGSSARSWRPDEIRRKDFTIRFRGFDANEVHGFHNALADDLARLHEQIAILRQENAQLRGDMERSQLDLQQAQADLGQARSDLQNAQVNPVDVVSDQAVLLLDQAQQLADALIDEGMQSARDLLVAARTHQRDIIDPNAPDVELAALQPAAANHGASDPGLASEVEEARMFAKVAQVQFRAVLESLNEQVNRLSQFSESNEQPDVPDVDESPRRPAVAARRNGNGV